MTLHTHTHTHLSRCQPCLCHLAIQNVLAPHLHVSVHSTTLEELDRNLLLGLSIEVELDETKGTGLKVLDKIKPVPGLCARISQNVITQRRHCRTDSNRPRSALIMVRMSTLARAGFAVRQKIRTCPPP